MERYDSLISLLNSYTKQELDDIFIFMREFKKIHSNRPKYNSNFIHDLIEKRLLEITSNNETPEQLEMLKRRIKKDIIENL